MVREYDRAPAALLQRSKYLSDINRVPLYSVGYFTFLPHISVHGAVYGYKMEYIAGLRDRLVECKLKNGACAPFFIIHYDFDSIIKHILRFKTNRKKISFC